MGGFAPRKYAIPMIFRAQREKSKESPCYRMHTNEPDAPGNEMEPRVLLLSIMEGPMFQKYPAILM